MFEKLFDLKFFLIIILKIYIFRKLIFLKIYYKNISFKKNKFDIFLVIFYIHNFKNIYFPKCLFLNNNNLFLFIFEK